MSWWTIGLVVAWVMTLAAFVAVVALAFCRVGHAADRQMDGAAREAGTWKKGTAA